MNEMIKSMVDALEQYNAGYVQAKFDEYSIFVTDNETAEFIEHTLDEEDENYQEMVEETDDFI